MNVRVGRRRVRERIADHQPQSPDELHTRRSLRDKTRSGCLAGHSNPLLHRFSCSGRGNSNVGFRIRLGEESGLLRVLSPNFRLHVLRVAAEVHAQRCTCKNNVESKRVISTLHTRSYDVVNTRICPAIQQQQLLSAPRFGALKDQCLLPTGNDIVIIPANYNCGSRDVGAPPCLKETQAYKMRISLGRTSQHFRTLPSRTRRTAHAVPLSPGLAREANT